MLGVKSSEQLRRRYSEIRVVHSVQEFVMGRTFELPCEGPISIDLMEGRVLELSSGHLKTPRTTENCVDWQKVTRVLISKVGRRDT